MKTLYCGLDVSNKSIAICIVDERGEIVVEFESVTEGVKVERALRGYKLTKCVVEASPLAETVCEWVEAAGHEVDILDVRQAKVVTATKKKTDRLDARKLAQLCRTGWYVRVHRKSGAARCMRSFLTARMQLVKASNGAASAIRGILRAHGVVIPDGAGKKFEQNIRQALRGADKLLIGAIDPLLRMWKLLQAEERQMYKALSKTSFVKSAEVRRLMTVPGVGPATAAAFAATIDDPKRFPTGEQVASYLGLVPSVYQSGNVEVKGRITKHGDNLLRWLLVEASITLLTRTKGDFALKSWGLKLQQAKGFGKARVAVARKLACLLHHLWRTKQTFDVRQAA